MRSLVFVALLIVPLFTACDGGSTNDTDSDASGPDASADVADDGAGDSGDGAEDAGDTEPDTGDDDIDDGGSGDAPVDAGSDAQDEEVDATVDVAPEVGIDGLPTALPFELTRPAAGDAPTDDEVAAFTRQITGFWRDTGYWRWVRMTSHGVDASNEEGWPDYALWWQDTQAIRDGDTVTFRHVGRADNLTLRTCKVLTNAIAGYLMTGDEDMRWIVEQYSKGIAALAMVMEFGDEDPAPYLQARAPFTRNHEYDTVGGRHVVIDYDPVRREEDAWNARIVHNPDNPYWGDVHFVNQRSKDDVPHMFRAVPMLRRAAVEAPDESVREAVNLALEYLEGFARDIYESEYQIRTKYEDGVPVVPTKDNGAVKDLASFTLFDTLVPNGECTSKLSSTLVGYGELRANACEDGSGDTYETVASTSHYFNYAIFRMFHVAAAHNALMVGRNGTAFDLIEGLGTRSTRMLHDPDMPNRDDPVFESDVAVFLLTAASAGMPLTGEEARHIHEEYTLSVEHYAPFEWWDPWADGLPDGEFDYKPHRGPAARITEMGYFTEYCYSPLRNPAGVEIIDCDIVADPERWGE